MIFPQASCRVVCLFGKIVDVDRQTQRRQKGASRRPFLFCRGHFLKGESPIRFEDAATFFVEFVLVRDVHADILHPDDIERAVGEGEIENIALIYFYAFVKRGEPIQQPRANAVVS